MVRWIWLHGFIACLVMALGCGRQLPVEQTTIIGEWEVVTGDGSELDIGFRTAGIPSMRFEFSDDGSGVQTIGRRKMPFTWKAEEVQKNMLPVMVFFKSERKMLEIRSGPSPETLRITWNGASGQMRKVTAKSTSGS